MKEYLYNFILIELTESYIKEAIVSQLIKTYNI